ncbi:MAG: hypothetical protein E7235_00335 [Lachnospiraceae bacterium]|nr:hypothetical protein [Lachnospiraceae bacterium]
MKKTIIFVLSVIMMLSFSACGNTMKGEEGIIEKARKEVPLADAEDMEIKIIGSHYLGDKYLFWLMTGNEYQHNRYFVMETDIKDEDEYEFVKLYEPMDRGMDIRALYYTCMGDNVLDTYYLFMVNNEDCVKMVLNGEEINIESHPFVYKYKEFEGEYIFLDKDGNEIR